MDYELCQHKRQEPAADRRPGHRQGAAPDGGLMTPEVFPRLANGALDELKDMSYQQRRCM